MDRVKRRWGTWSVWVIAPLAWFAQQQVIDSLVRVDCSRMDPGRSALFGVLTIALILVCATVSWRSGARGEASRVDRFAGLGGVLIGAIFAFAALLQLLAGVVIPSCIR